MLIFLLVEAHVNDGGGGETLNEGLGHRTLVREVGKVFELQLRKPRHLVREQRAVPDRCSQALPKDRIGLLLVFEKAAVDTPACGSPVKDF